MNPINILKYGAEEEKSESARMVSHTLKIGSIFGMM